MLETEIRRLRRMMLLCCAYMGLSYHSQKASESVTQERWNLAMRNKSVQLRLLFC